jgi:sodium/potassium-transporting ATPase subunit alpha
MFEVEGARHVSEKIRSIKERRKVRTKKKSTDEKEEVSRKTNKIREIDAHRLEMPQFLTKMNISEDTLKNGLSTSEAEKRNLEQGDNMLTQKKKTPWYMKLIHELTTFFSLMLWAGSILCFIAYGIDKSDPSNLYLGVVLAIVVFTTGIITFFQNAKSDSIMEGFKNFIPPKCRVMRDGKEELVLAAKIVVGDVVKVKAGERVPGDLRIIESQEMRVDNSSLTGESDPLIRVPECTDPEKILETKNVAFFGTLCKEGEGKGVVFHIGDSTIIGQIAGLAATAKAGKTPLRRELDRFIKMITVIALCLGLLFFCCGFILKYSVIQNLVFAIGIIVANVPEGLLATITITLSVAAKKLGAKKVMVKNLESVETLGSTSCICSDKTGTLTQNIMTVENLWYNLKVHEGKNKEKHGDNYNYEYDPQSHGFKELQRCAVLNSVAIFSAAMPEKMVLKLDNVKNNNPQKYQEEKLKFEQRWKEELANTPFYKREVIGDASETALVKFFQPFGDIVETRKREQLGERSDGSESKIVFNSAYKFAMQIFRTPDDPDNSFVAYMKGAPEIVFNKCTKILIDGREEPMSENYKNEFRAANKRFAKNGERVLGFTKMNFPRSDYPDNHKFELNDPRDLEFPLDFCFIGLVSLMDPPRDAVPNAVDKCKTAGIKVIMVTGDQQLTASAIAKKIGIFEDESSIDLYDRFEGRKSMEECVQESNAIVINGQMLTQAVKEDEGLPENEKGKKLEKWLKKPQIVFARTSPAQKLYIVKGCQRLGYTVAVTGDGVNDSPAIKQADIGIAMGITGSDVAKDSADMILLNDDFSAIVLGIEEGRKIFDNLKKSICYTLTSNIPELVPFLMFIILAIPLPLSTVLILCVDIGTDIFPGVSFAYEDSELDIMTRRPRSHHEHLVNKKLMTVAYVQMGIIQTCGGFLTFFLVMYDFGFTPQSLIRLIVKPYIPHNSGDVYDPTHPFFGNTNAQCSDGVLKAINAPDKDVLEDSTKKIIGYTLDWLFTTDIDQDTRMGFLDNLCASTNEGDVRVKALLDFSKCQVFQISPISGRPVCFSTEALKYAQTSFFFSIVMTQFSNSLSCKTRKLSLSQQGLSNTFMMLGWCVEFTLTFFLGYCRPINHVFGTRDVSFAHYGIFSVFFSILMLCYDETRKFLIRNYPRPKKNPEKPNWFERNTLY